MQTIYDNHICIYTIYPLYNECIVIISQSLCIPHVQPCPRCDFPATPLAWMMKVYRSWWHPVEPHLNPEDPNDRWEFSVGKSTWHMKSLRLNGGEKGDASRFFRGCEVVLLLNKTKLKPWCLDHLLTLGGLQRFDVCFFLLENHLYALTAHVWKFTIPWNSKFQVTVPMLV